MTNYLPELPGSLTVILGPMFASKTTRLLALYRIAKIGGLHSILISPKIDTRGLDAVVTHDGHREPAIKVGVTDAMSIVSLAVNGSAQHVFIDEVQFFGKEIESAVDALLAKQISVTVAGLDYDYLKNPFGSTLELSSGARLEWLTANCTTALRGGGLCGEPARWTRRLYAGPRITIGGANVFAPACAKHWRKPRQDT